MLFATGLMTRRHISLEECLSRCCLNRTAWDSLPLWHTVFLRHNESMAGDIYEDIVELRRSGRRGALATIVVRKGSTPRKDPAKMLIYEDGRQVGSIGGGCTEAEVCREALMVMRWRNQSAQLRSDRG